jgi:hypothetical protein
MPLIAKIHEGPQALIDLNNHITAGSAVAPVGTTVRLILLAPER